MYELAEGWAPVVGSDHLCILVGGLACRLPVMPRCFQTIQSGWSRAAPRRCCFSGTKWTEFSRYHVLILHELAFYRASICEGGLGSYNSVCLSVCLWCLSVRRVDCDKTKWHTADILISHERAITLLLWYQQRLVGDDPFPLKSALKVTHPLRKNADFDRFPLITS